MRLINFCFYPLKRIYNKRCFNSKSSRLRLLAPILFFIFCGHAAAFTNSNNQNLEAVKGKPIFIQIFKQEKILELYSQDAGKYNLVKTYPICNYSGGLGPKKRQGDYKSPEGFYEATFSQLKPDSEYHRAINLGYPNQYDMYHGYSGNFLMIHGDCVSVGCYAMQNGPMEEIYNMAEAALSAGQSVIPIHIYPFRMTKSNLEKQKHSVYYEFWQDLAKGYEYFQKNNRPAKIFVNDGRYALHQEGNSDTHLASQNSYLPNADNAVNQLTKPIASKTSNSNTAKSEKSVRSNSSDLRQGSQSSSAKNKKVPSLLEEAALLQSIQSAKSR